ncbi:MAG: DUF885 domain-containing protein [Gammaproteobacteria bacterium]
MKPSLFPVLLVAGVLAGCGADTPPPAAPAAGQPDSATAREDQADALAGLFAGYWEDQLALNPLRATFLGDHRYNDRLPNFLGAEYRAKEREMLTGYLERARAVDAGSLGEQDRLSLEMFISDLEEELEGERFPAYLIPVNQFRNIGNWIAQLGSGTGAQPFETVQDYENWLKRVDGFVVIVDQAIANMREGMAKGVVQPRVLVEKTIPQVAAHVVEDPQESIFYRVVADFPETVPASEQERLRSAYVEAIRTELVPAYARLRDFLRDEYLPEARETVGLYALPDGEAWYAYLARRNTTTSLTPDEIHEIGLSEVARIHGEMRGVMEQVGFEGTLDEFFEYLNTEPRFYFETREQLLAGYEALRAKADAAAPALFSRLPKAGFEIRPVEPFREQSAAKGSYMAPSVDGTRPGVFYVNTYDLSARPSWAMESLFLHEAIPGHHFQGALSLELDHLPAFRRFGSYTAYGEGWGLYAESLGREMGFYTDPYQYFGKLNAELWRSIRLVVDTGIHRKGWSREQVLQYMYNNSAVKPSRAIAEAERYMAIPGQALAYKIGQLKILQLRDRAEAALGEDFDVRAFHAQILENGELPLGVLEAGIDRWIARSAGEEAGS